MAPPYPIPMAAPRQKGQGTCPRSHSEQKGTQVCLFFLFLSLVSPGAIDVPISSAETLLCSGHLSGSQFIQTIPSADGDLPGTVLGQGTEQEIDAGPGGLTSQWEDRE